MYFEVEAHAQDARMAQAVRDDALINMNSMGTVPGRPTDVAVFYAQSYSIVKYLIDVYGPERVIPLLSSLDEGLSIDVALQSSHGFGLKELERNWKDDLVGETTFVWRPDLGTLGTSVLIAAAGVAASFAAYLISRRYWSQIID